MAYQPKRLYDICVSAVVLNCGKFEGFYKIQELPDNVLLDCYNKMYEEKRICVLLTELNNVSVLSRMIKVTQKRIKLLRCFQAVVNHGSTVTDDILSNFRSLAGSDILKATDDLYTIDIGLKIASFFIEGSWYRHAIYFLNEIENLCKAKSESAIILLRLLDCYHKKLRAESIYCVFTEAEKTLQLALDVTEKLRELNIVPNLAGLYSNISCLYFARSEYDKAYEWALKSLDLLDDNLPPRVIIEILRQASKSCVVRQRFQQAKLLITEAIAMVTYISNPGNNLFYSDTLMDYGYYLLNYDSVPESVRVYHVALELRKVVFGSNNIQVAIGHEDFAYASYVNEYSSGRFYAPKENAEEALRIMNRILPKNHLMFVQAMRVKALILEEIALDNHNVHNFEYQDELLLEAEKLHREALNLSYKAFGEHNIQTAKHYGNLGRLYQTMGKYKVAETMHLKAIAIKEEIFGPDDYEVGLSMGHLASLYSFHMARLEEAEKLYKKSIEISLKLFGPNYSGLEYDYRGLIHIYTETNDIDNLLHYTRTARELRHVRDTQVVGTDLPKAYRPISIVVAEFFKMC